MPIISPSKGRIRRTIFSLQNPTIWLVWLPHIIPARIQWDSNNEGREVQWSKSKFQATLRAKDGPRHLLRRPLRIWILPPLQFHQNWIPLFPELLLKFELPSTAVGIVFQPNPLYNPWGCINCTALLPFLSNLVARISKFSCKRLLLVLMQMSIEAEKRLR